MNFLKYNILLKLVIILVMILLLLIPAMMIRGLVSERQHRQAEAISEVSSKWGGEQTLTGPILSIPYHKYGTNYDGDSYEYLHILPEQLNYQAVILPEKRHRGIYDVVVYNADITASGDFGSIDLEAYDLDASKMFPEKAFLSIGISDLAGVEEQVKLEMNEISGLFNPGTISNDVISRGIHVPVSLAGDSIPMQFSLDLKLKGSQVLSFVPMGKVTEVRLTSDWKDPSFNGSFLPDESSVSDEGFTARWNILHLNRDFPQAWKGSMYNVQESSFGVDLIQPVDNYQKTERSVKYAILFIVFTFLVFFFVEVLARRFIHPIQYILVGIALIVFFSLLLAFSEHMAFNLAYLISAVSVLSLISVYVLAIIKSARLTFVISGLLSILYVFIFIILQIHDYALLTGSIGIFVVLAFVMYFSRKIDWYSIKINTSGEEEKLGDSPEA